MAQKHQHLKPCVTESFAEAVHHSSLCRGMMYSATLHQSLHDTWLRQQIAADLAFGVVLKNYNLGGCIIEFCLAIPTLRSQSVPGRSRSWMGCSKRLQARSAKNLSVIVGPCLLHDCMPLAQECGHVSGELEGLMNEADQGTPSLMMIFLQSPFWRQKSYTTRNLTFASLGM